MFTQLRMLFLSVPGIAFLLTSYRDLQDDPERGDVPGWVMITMMSAVLVAAILAIAQPALTKMFNDAIALVHQ